MSPNRHERGGYPRCAEGATGPAGMQRQMGHRVGYPDGRVCAHYPPYPD